jgi:hypothetical protein
MSGELTEDGFGNIAIGKTTALSNRERIRISIRMKGKTIDIRMSAEAYGLATTGQEVPCVVRENKNAR